MQILPPIFLCTLLFFVTIANGQVFSAGIKTSRSAMFQASVNYPFIFDSDKRSEFTAGLDYTTGNRQLPSGLQPQVTGMVTFLDAPQKKYMLAAGITGGYLISFSNRFQNQLRISPHFYFEYQGLINIKTGYDHFFPFNKGQPFVSVGIGGFLMFRHMRYM